MRIARDPHRCKQVSTSQLSTRRIAVWAALLEGETLETRINVN